VPAVLKAKETVSLCTAFIDDGVNLQFLCRVMVAISFS
jgi:hypothetical protein